MSKLETLVRAVKSQWERHHYMVRRNVEKAKDLFIKGMNEFARIMVKLMIIGIIVNIIASSFYPEFPERFPTLYGWFDGCLQFGEFIVKAGIYGIYSLLTGHWNSFWAEYDAQFKELMNQASVWFSALKF